MKYPEKPTCHGDLSPVFKIGEMRWREPDNSREPYGYPFRTCSYCGSIHPEDLIRFLQRGNVGLDGSDWKYGWPHKFYVEGIPNPLAGQTVQNGSLTENGVTTPIMGPAPEVTHSKWYNNHLRDEGYDEEALSLLFALLTEHSAIEFNFDERGLSYRAPYRGYQHQSPQSKARFEAITKSLS